MHGKFTGRYRCCVTATCDDSHGSGRNLFLFDAGKNRRSKKGIADAKSRVRSGRKRRRIRENRTGNISPPAPSVNVTRHIPLSTITSRYKDARLEKSIRQGGYSIQFVLSGFSASFVTI